jgi:predicted NBD/HSP70 family sugar kinase
MRMNRSSRSTRAASSTKASPPLALAPVHRRVLTAVARGRALTRAGIAHELRLSRSNLSPVILDLLSQGLLVSVGQDESRGGRRGDLLGFAGAEAAIVAGLEIDIDRVRIVVASLGVRVSGTTRLTVDVARDPEHALELAATALLELVRRDSYGPLVGLGVSLPAAVDAAAGVAAVAPGMPEWVGFPVVDWLSEHLSTRVFLDSDLNALTLAEMTVPHHPSLGSAFLVVKARDGIGCGIVVNDSIFRGSQGAAGEIGHTCVDPNDPRICACGHRGCLEAVIAPANLAIRARELAAEERSPILGPLLDRVELRIDTIGAAVVEGDPLAIVLLRELGIATGFVLAGAISFFNPSSIVISTGRMPGSDVLIAAIQHGVYARAFPGATRRLQIVESGLGEDAVAVGAAVLARDGFLGGSGRATAWAPVGAAAS